MMSIYCEARNFAEKFIDPYSKKVDEEGVFPVEPFAEIKKSDFLTLLIPRPCQVFCSNFNPGVSRGTNQLSIAPSTSDGAKTR